MLRGEAITYVLIPEGTTDKLQFFDVDVITETGRPISPLLTVNPFQVASLRDPNLTIDGAGPRLCLKECGLVQRLKERAAAAAHILPEIVPTDKPPNWSRYAMSPHRRETLWRAGGAV